MERQVTKVIPENRWRKELEKYPHGAYVMEIHPKKTALVIIDMQYYDAHPEHTGGKSIKSRYPDLWPYWAERLTQVAVPNCVKLLTFFRKHQLRVVHVTFGAETVDGSDMLPFRKLGDGKKSFFSKGDTEHRILEELTPMDGELVLNKNTRCVFNSTGLDHALRMMGMETLVFVGTDTAACVESSARGSSDRGYNTIVIDDACATSSQSLQDASMIAFARAFGRVMDTEELMEDLSRHILEKGEGRSG
jgi:nicotinamidase-related amidase